MAEKGDDARGRGGEGRVLYLRGGRVRTTEPYRIDHTRLARINMPRRLWFSRQEMIGDPDAKLLISKYFDRIEDMIDTGTNLLISGPPGVGKSSAAAIVVKGVLRWGHKTYVISHDEMSDLVFSDRQYEEGISVMDRIRTCDLLMLDNFNADIFEDKRFGVLKLEKLIERRTNAQLATVLTTRIAPDDERFAGVVRLVKSNGMGLYMNGEDWAEKSEQLAHERIYGD